MYLSNLIKDLRVLKIIGDDAVRIKRIVYDSRVAKKGDIFVCKGVFSDGHEYIDDAYNKGVRVFLIEKDLDNYYKDACYVYTDDTKKALSLISRTFYKYPEKELFSIAVTGTKGKTTSTYMIKSFFDKASMPCGMIGTIYSIVGNRKIESKRTTDEGPIIQNYLREMVYANDRAVTMEVSSHAIDLGRVYGVLFDIGIFTNLSIDHLDYHKTLENYFNVKKRMFDQVKKSVINIDDEYGKRLYKELSLKMPCYSISIEDENADYYASSINQSMKGTSFDVFVKGESKFSFHMSQYGIYNVSNALGAIASAHIAGFDLEDLTDALGDLNVPGRQEKYKNDKDYLVIIDYAHSPTSMESILKTFEGFKKGRLICVFGAGGDRDKTKRPLMGEVSARLADYSIVTTDNPRTEKEEDIIEDIISGMKDYSNKYEVVVSRPEAIKKAVMMAKKDDIIVLCGKGHENYQEINGVKYPMDERIILKEIYKEIDQ